MNLSFSFWISSSLWTRYKQSKGANLKNLKQINPDKIRIIYSYAKHAVCKVDISYLNTYVYLNIDQNVTNTSKKKTNIFISYRRSDSAAVAGRIYDQLNSLFTEHIFFDVETIEPGIDFVQVIRTALASCGVMIVVIGKKWLVSEATGTRLGDENDYVTLEVQTALDSRMPIIPVLVNGAFMPSQSELPEALSSIAQLNALEIRHTAFSRDMEALINTLYETLGGKLPSKFDKILQLILFPTGGRLNESYKAFWAIFSLVIAVLGIGVVILSVLQLMTTGTQGLILPLSESEDITYLGAVLMTSLMGIVGGWLGRMSVRRRRWGVLGLQLSCIILIIGVGLLVYYLIDNPGSSFMDIFG